MIYVYGLAYCNCFESKIIYNEIFPIHPAPNQQTFRPFENAPVAGRPLTTRTPELEETVILVIEEDRQIIFELVI